MAVIVQDPDILRNAKLWRLGQRYGRHHYDMGRLAYHLQIRNICGLQADIVRAGCAAGWAETSRAERFLNKLKAFWRAT